MINFVEEMDCVFKYDDSPLEYSVVMDMLKRGYPVDSLDDKIREQAIKDYWKEVHDIDPK